MPGQQPLGSIGQRFAEAVDAAMIGRDQSVLFRQPRGQAQARNARCGREPGGDQSAT